MGHKLEPQKQSCSHAWHGRAGSRVHQWGASWPFKRGAAQWAGQEPLQPSTQDWPRAGMNLNVPCNSYHRVLPGLSTTSFDTPFHGAGNLSSGTIFSAS